mgnify:CR=1 FL=1
MEYRALERQNEAAERKRAGGAIGAMAMRVLARRILTSAMMAATGAILSGCGGVTTETGYKPQPLGDNETIRKGYYAAPFSARAQAAERERKADSRPGLYGEQIYNPPY